MPQWAFWVFLALFSGVIGHRIWIRTGVAYAGVQEIQARLSSRDPMLILDLRNEKAFRARHLPGAVHMPPDKLRKQMSDLNAAHELLLLCQDGMESIRMYRTLKARGFSAMRVVDGGMNRWPWETVSESK